MQGCSQLELFVSMAGFSPRARTIDSSLFSQSIQSEREERRSGDWEQSVIDYLDFMAGTRWRRGRARYRKSPTYLWYAGGLRLMASVRNAYAPCNCPYCLAEFGVRRSFIGPIPPELTAAAESLPPKKEVASVRTKGRRSASA
jgi:hypothetical protein